MSVGFLASDANWEVVQSGLDPAVDVAWVVHHPTGALDQLRLEPVRVLVVEARHEMLTEEIVGSCDRLGVELAALITAPDGEAIAEARGVGQKVRQPHDLVQLVTRATRSTSQSPGLGEGLLLTVWGPTGSPGRTTIALTIAAILADQGLSVMVVDADPRGGTVSSMLGLLDDVPGFLAACRLAGKGELTEAQIRRLRSVYTGRQTSFHVLTGVSRMTRVSDAPRDHIDDVLALLRGMYPVVIVDAGSDLVPQESPPGTAPGDQAVITSHLVSVAEHLVHVVEASLMGISRFARAQRDVEALSGQATTHYLLNGTDTSKKALKEEALLREALWRYTGLEAITAVPRDPHVREALFDACTLVDLGRKQPVVQALASECAEWRDSALARAGRQQRRAPDGVQYSPPRLGMVDRGFAWWRSLTALR